MNDNRCALCGKLERLTFEHIPPQCAFNKKSIYIHNHEHLSEPSSPLYGKKSRSNKGFGKLSLCSACNNNSGSWYVKAFCEFAGQGLKILQESDPSNVIKGEFNIKPLNVIKQIIMMFVSADTSGILRSHKGVIDYLMNKKNIEFPEKINIYLYSNASSNKRMIGYSAVREVGEEQNKYWSEINYQPFGYFLTYDSMPPNQYMTNITGFKNFKYDQNSCIIVPTLYLAVSTPLIGHYDNIPIQ